MKNKSLKKDRICNILTVISLLFAFYFIYQIASSKNNQLVNNEQEVPQITDAIKFKNEYEALNNTIREKDGKTIRSIELPSNNPFIYKEPQDIINMINNKETFMVYFGFTDCPWCRSILPTLSKVATDNNISKIYYVDVKDIRDTFELDSKNKPVRTKEGTKEYYELLTLLDNVLADYTLTTSKNKKVSTKEKRIFAPNVVAVINGEAKELTSGISPLQTDGYMELTDEMNTDMYNKLKCIATCLNDSKNTCEIKSSC